MDASIPPWLAVNPRDFISAMHSGLSAGLQIAGEQNRARESSDRAAESSREADMRAWESEQNRIMRQEQLQEDSARRMAEAGALRDYRLGQLDLGRERLGQQAEAAGAMADYRTGRLGETMDHNMAMEELAQVRAEEQARRGQAKVVTFPELPGFQFVENPSGAVTLVGRPDRPMTESQKVNLEMRALSLKKRGSSELPNDPAYQERVTAADRMLESARRGPQLPGVDYRPGSANPVPLTMPSPASRTATSSGYRYEIVPLDEQSDER